MTVNNDIRHVKEKPEFLGKKVIHYQHHTQLLDVCLKLQIAPKALEIRKTPYIRVTNNKFLENWRSNLKDVELTLMRELTEKNKCIYSELQSKFFIQIEEAIESNIDISVIKDLKQHYSKI